MSLSSTQKRRVSLFAGVLVAALVAAWCIFGGQRYVSTENAYVKADKISVAPEVTGVVAQVPIRANQPVKKGDLLVKLDDAPYQLAVAEAKANLAKVRNDILSKRGDYGETEAELKRAQTDAQFYQRQLDRNRQLDKVAVSAQQLDESRQALARAKAKIAVYNEQLASLKAELAGGPDMPLDQHPDVQAAQARLEKAQYELDRTILRAPADGLVANAVPLSGEMAPAGVPLVTVIRTDDIWVEANLKETELNHVRAGQDVEVSVDAYPGQKWKAVVDSLSPASGSEYALIPPQNASGNWVKVVQRIPVRVRLMSRPDAPPLRAGMSAEVEIDTESGHSQTAGLE